MSPPRYPRRGRDGRSGAPSGFRGYRPPSYPTRPPARGGGRSPRRGGPRRSPFRTVGLVVLPFVLSGLIAVGAYFYPIAAVALQQTGQQGGTAAGPAVAPGAPFTMLLMGSDNDAKFQGNPLTQSMILVRVDPTTKQVAMLSIPRDLYVHLSTGGYQKIDAAYSAGGATAAVQTVEQDFNVHIDYWAWIGLTGLVKLVDLVGGIDISPTNPVLDDQYPNDVGTSNPYSLGRIAVLPGSQHLNGTQALQYVRSRHDDIREDFGRSFRQQQVLLALRVKAKQLNAADLPDLMGGLQGQFKTSMSLTEMRGLLPLANQVQPGSIHQVVLVGGYTSNGYAQGEQVLMPNWNLIQSTAHQYFPAA
ncbi:MAG: LCP family protein [Candidatus Dormiibacterota bacterium]